MKRMATALLVLGAAGAFSACMKSVPGATCAKTSDCQAGACVDGVCILPADAGPALSLSRPAEGEVVRDELVIAGRATDAIIGVASVEYSVAGADWAPLALSGDAFQIALSPSPQAIDYRAFTLSVRATDRAGRSTTVAVHYAVDQVAPSIGLPAPLDVDGAKVNASSPGMACLRDTCTLTLAPVLADRGTAHVASAKLDGADAPVRSGAVALSFPASESGGEAHRLEVVALDEAGNRAQVSRQFRVDVDPPKVAFLEPAADFDCSADLCTGAVVNLASPSGGKSLALSGTASDPEASFTLKIGDQPETSLARGSSGEWSYPWEIGSAKGEVDVVARAVDSFGNETAVARKIWIDVVAPTCAYGPADGDRRVGSAAALLACDEPMSLASLRSAVALAPAAVGSDAFLDAGNAFHASKSPLLGNTTFSLALRAGATDKAGNPAKALAQVRFRTAPVLPAGDSLLGQGLDHPRMAVDADGLPLVFAWDAAQGRPVLFAWDGHGDGSAGVGAWVSSTPLGDGGGLGPVRDFRLAPVDPSSLPLNPDLSLRRAGRVLLSPEVPDPAASNAVAAAYAESEDGLATFHGVRGAGFGPDVLAGLSPGAHPSFFGVQEAVEDPAGGWIVRGPLVEKVLFSSFSEHKVQARTHSEGWPVDSTALAPIAASVASMHQAGFLGTGAGAAEPHAFLAAVGDAGAAVSIPQGSTPAVAGLRPLFHSAQGAGYAAGFIAWSEHPVSGSPAVRLRVGCSDAQSGGPWVFHDEAVAAGATEVAGVDFGQGVSRVAIAVDAVAPAGRMSQFGLLSGDACGAAFAVDWSGAGGAMEGRSPTTAFSSSGVLWRALVSSEGLRVLAPLRP